MKDAEKNRMTMNQLAKELKISRMTLYNIMHQKGSYSEETEERVQQALEEYNFRVNNNARNLAKTRNIKLHLSVFTLRDLGIFLMKLIPESKMRLQNMKMMD